MAFSPLIVVLLFVVHCISATPSPADGIRKTSDNTKSIIITASVIVGLVVLCLLPHMLLQIYRKARNRIRRAQRQQADPQPPLPLYVDTGSPYMSERGRSPVVRQSADIEQIRASAEGIPFPPRAYSPRDTRRYSSSSSGSSSSSS